MWTALDESLFGKAASQNCNFNCTENRDFKIMREIAKSICKMLV
jgi:hypothetical protein